MTDENTISIYIPEGSYRLLVTPSPFSKCKTCERRAAYVMHMVVGNVVVPVSFEPASSALGNNVWPTCEVCLPSAILGMAYWFEETYKTPKAT